MLSDEKESQKHTSDGSALSPESEELELDPLAPTFKGQMKSLARVLEAVEMTDVHRPQTVVEFFALILDNTCTTRDFECFNSGGSHHPSQSSVLVRMNLSSYVHWPTRRSHLHQGTHAETPRTHQTLDWPAAVLPKRLKTEYVSSFILDRITSLMPQQSPVFVCPSQHMNIRLGYQICASSGAPYLEY